MGLAETPVFLTSTMQLGRVYDAACELLIAEDAGGSATDDVIIPIVAECDDSFLNDARRMQVTAADVRDRAGAPPGPSAGGPARRRPRARSAPGRACAASASRAASAPPRA